MYGWAGVESGYFFRMYSTTSIRVVLVLFWVLDYDVSAKLVGLVGSLGS